MYGLPPHFDASVFLGHAVELVSFSANTVYVAFDGGLSITIESSFAHTPGDDASARPRQEVPIRESALMQLIGPQVKSAEGGEDGTLTLRFEDGQQLECFDDLAQYECYHITIGTKEIHI